MWILCTTRGRKNPSLTADPTKLRPPRDDPPALQHVRPAASGPTAIIPTIISQALTRPSIRLGSLDPRRDLTYVQDTVSGFVAIAGCDAALGRVVNVGRGEDISIGELVERIAARLGHPGPRRDRLRPRPPQGQRGRPPPGRHGIAQELWGWQPQYTLDQGARRDHRLGPRTTSASSGSTSTRPDAPGGHICDSLRHANLPMTRSFPIERQLVEMGRVWGASLPGKVGLMS